MSTKQLSVVLRAIDQLSGPMRSALGEVANFGRGVIGTTGKVASALTSVRGLIAGALGGFTAWRGFTALRDTADELDRVLKLSRQTGQSVEDLSALRYAASLADEDFRTLAEAFGTAQKNLGMFSATGGGRASEWLRRIGVQARDARGQFVDLGKGIPDIIGAVQRLPQLEQRVAAARAIFGSAGEAMLRLDVGKLRAFTDEAGRLGVIFSPGQAQRADEFGDAITRVGQAWFGLKVRVLDRVGPELTDLLNRGASVIAAVPEMLANLAGQVRSALRGGPAGDEARAALHDLWVDIAALTRTGVTEVGRVLMASLADVARAVIRLGPSIVREVWQEAFVQPLSQAQEKLGRWLADEMLLPVGDRIADAARRGREALGQNIRDLTMEGIDEALRSWELTADAGATAFTNMSEAMGRVGEGLDGLLGATEALARTRLELRALAGDAEAGGVEAMSRLREFADGLREAYDAVDAEAGDARRAGVELGRTVSRALTDDLASAVVQMGRAWKESGAIIRQWSSDALADLAQVATRMLLVRALAGIGGAFAGAGAAASPYPDYVQGPLGTLLNPNVGGLITGQGLRTLAGVQRFRLGGIVPGPSYLGRDIIPALLTPGEGVLNRAAVARHGEGLVHHLNRGGVVAPVGGAGGRGDTIVVNLGGITINGGAGGATVDARMLERLKREVPAAVLAAIHQRRGFRDQFRRGLGTGGGA